MFSVVKWFQKVFSRKNHPERSYEAKYHVPCTQMRYTNYWKTMCTQSKGTQLAEAYTVTSCSTKFLESLICLLVCKLIDWNKNQTNTVYAFTFKPIKLIVMEHKEATNVKYGQNVPFCPWVMLLNNETQRYKMSSSHSVTIFGNIVSKCYNQEHLSD